MNQHIFFSFS